MFKKDNCFSKVYLWHFYEEIEHHQESSYLFVIYHKNMRYVLVLIGFALYVILIGMVQIFVLTTVLMCSPWKFKLHMTLKTIDHYFQHTGIGLLAVFLLFFNLNSIGAVVKKDLEIFDKKFEEKFKCSFDTDAITFE